MQNHSLTHPYGSELKTEQTVARQVHTVNDDMAAAIGVRPTTFRAPFGTTSSWVKLGVDMPLIQWTIDPKDQNARPRTILTRLTNALYDGGIVLMHDTGKNTADAIPLIAQLLLDEGYMTVTIDELAAMNGVVLEPGVVYYEIGIRE